MKPKNVWMKTNGQCTSHTKDQVNGVNLRFASNQKIIESYKDANIYIYIYLFSIFIFFGCLYSSETQYLCGCFFSLGYGSCKLFFFFFGFLFFLYEKFLLSFMLIIIQKKVSNLIRF